ncbi:MAG: hypothetical protein MJZ81_06120 [Bacteroidales bacterium]|nr:hypothetical protein [Bacteroidales bacterium]
MKIEIPNGTSREKRKAIELLIKLLYDYPMHRGCHRDRIDQMINETVEDIKWMD